MRLAASTGENYDMFSIVVSKGSYLFCMGS